MKKGFVTFLGFLFVATQLFAWGDYPQKKNVDMNQDIKYIKGLNINKDLQRPQLDPRIKIPRPIDIINIPCQPEAINCDKKEKRYRVCDNNQEWGAWVELSPGDKELMENCLKLKECWPGEYRCNLRDHAYRVCKNGYWNPPNNGWDTLLGKDPPVVEEIRRNCAIDASRYIYGQERCWPGQYICNYRDYQYYICGDGGQWNTGGGGTLSGAIVDYYGKCEYRRPQ